MGYYSQGEEDKILEEYFKGTTGRLLEIGAYHPTVFSNSRRLIELGWEGILIEPSPKCFEAINDFYKDNDLVHTLNIAIGPGDGVLEFYDSAGGVATAYEVHYNAWKNKQLDYEKIDIPCSSWDTFYKKFSGIYDFISIDTEGMDWSILQQIDLDMTKTKVICIETTYFINEMYNYLMGFGFTQKLYLDGNNLILARD